MTEPDDQSEMYRWYRAKVQEINEVGRRRRRLDNWSLIAYMVILFSLGSLLASSIQQHRIQQVVVAALGTVATLTVYWLKWHQLDRIRSVDLSAVLNRPSGEERGSGDV